MSNLSNLSKALSDKALFAEDHRYGYDVCVALVDSHLLETMGDLTAGGDSFNPYGFASWINRCNPKGCPVAYGEDLAAALEKLDAQWAHVDIDAEARERAYAIHDVIAGAADEHGALYDYFDDRPPL